MIRVAIFNKLHFPIEIDGTVFPPREEVFVRVRRSSVAFRRIRANKNLRIGKHDNLAWDKKMPLEPSYTFNMVRDIYSQHRGRLYEHVITSLADPIIPFLPKGSTGYLVKPSLGINLRFFSSARINQLGKYPVGPHDVFCSHGIADKDYRIARKIADYKNAFVSGPAWEKRTRDSGYKGDIWITGYTKLDPIFNGEYVRQEREKPYVVWAPTHRSKTQRSSYPQCMTLIKQIPDCYETGLALHPTARAERKRKHIPSMQDLLDADVVIADVGSTVYEAWALGKPVVFPDWICKDAILKRMGKDNFERRIYTEKIGYHAKDMKQLIKMVEKAVVDGITPEEVEFMEQILPAKLRGNSGKASAKALMQIKKNLRI